MKIIIAHAKDTVIGTTLGHRFLIVAGEKETPVESTVPVQELEQPVPILHDLLEAIWESTPTYENRVHSQVTGARLCCIHENDHPFTHDSSAGRS